MHMAAVFMALGLAQAAALPPPVVVEGRRPTEPQARRVERFVAAVATPSGYDQLATWASNDTVCVLTGDLQPKAADALKGAIEAQARRLLGDRLAAMVVARGRVEAARAALGMPLLVEVEERAAKAAADEAARVAFKALGVLSGEGH